MQHSEFNYGSLEQLISAVHSLGLKLNFSKNLELFKKRVEVDGFVIPNSLAIHPMEGSDGELDGRPGELTKRRYECFSTGGAGLIWFEAIAIVNEGRASPRQLWITEENVSDFQKLFDSMVASAQKENGNGFIPLCIAQLTHSGRYSKPEGKPAPIIAYHDPYRDTKHNIDPYLPVIEDNELERLEDAYVEAAVLAGKAGFHGVDVKCCHGYLNCELLSGFTRKGRYGETFEGRTRFLTNIVDKIRNRLGKDFIIASRINIYDAIPYPYGWGVNKGDVAKYDMTEPIKLLQILYKKGVRLVNLTMGNPYYNPHVNRPYDKGGYIPSEHPLVGVERMINGIGEVQKALKDIVVVGTGYSWLRQFSANLAAGSLEKGLATIIGYGREGFAYPDFARDIIENGEMKKEKCCITCGKCAELLRAGTTSGCVIKDSRIYAPRYNQYCKK